MTTSATELTAYQRLRAVWRAAGPHHVAPEPAASTGLVAAGIRTGFGDDWLRIGGIKLFADGAMGSGTAAFYAPYADDPSTSGLLIQSPEALERKMRDADAAGFQLIVHAIGDKANATVLDILGADAAASGCAGPAPAHRARAGRARRRQGALRRRSSVIASIQPSHCIDDMRWAEKRIGRARAAEAYDFKSFVTAGVRIAFGTDWFVEPLDPMLGLYAAVTRQFPDGTPDGGWFPEERLTLAQAIEFYTAGSAYAEFADSRKGRVKAGYLADLVVLSKNLFDIPPREILTTKPMLTIVGGRVVHDAMRAGFATVNRQSSQSQPIANSDGLARRLPHALRDRGQHRARAARDARHRLDSVGRPGAVDLSVHATAWSKCASPCRRSWPTQALRIIAEHREQVPAGVVLSLGQSLARLERRIGYRFRDSGLLEHALTHKSKAHEDATGGVVDNESLEFLGDAVLGFVDRRPAVSRVPAVPGRAEVEGQGGDGLDGGAGGAGRAHRAGRLPAARPRRREDRRAPQAGAAGRRLRGAHRGALSRRRHRGRARRSC